MRRFLVTFIDWALSRDEDAMSLLGSNWAGLVPVAVEEMENVCITLYQSPGHGDYATELHLRSANELIQNKKYYVEQHKEADHALCCESIDKSINDCTINHSFLSVWSMHAACSVIGKSDNSVYPIVNGPLDNCVVILNRLKSSRQLITIMWSGPTRGTGTWTPNHFLPMLGSSCIRANTVDTDNEEEIPPLSPVSSFSQTKCCDDKVTQKEHTNDIHAQSNKDTINETHCIDNSEMTPPDDSQFLNATSLDDVYQPDKTPDKNS
ncbi:vertnin-like [Ostrea edulis]|uniref:vertnin-like n=1 Tax=Ostrea edulis TaxID=37623 RepID=UPI0024AEDF00|nr:vertnin-like [Ostrea edulis]